MALRMMSCCVCGEFSGRMEICPVCALMLWPHQSINSGAKQLAAKLMPVPDPVPRHAVHLLDR
jgi:hypothetical protein